MLYNQTPKHRNNFLKLAGEGFYNGTLFHRVIKEFITAAGDRPVEDVAMEVSILKKREARKIEKQMGLKKNIL